VAAGDEVTEEQSAERLLRDHFWTGGGAPSAEPNMPPNKSPAFSLLITEGRSPMRQRKEWQQA